MTKQILVTYATRAGSTGEIAEAIGQSIASHGFVVDVKPVLEKPSLDGYEGVVIGSAVRMGQWLPEAAEFLKTNQSALMKMPTAIFTVHILNLADDQTSQTYRESYITALKPLVQPVDSAFFGGKLDYKRVKFADRLIGRLVKAVESDSRDWDKIRGWGSDLAEKLE
ncbi:flavodoxin [bacterium]|nr:flavodoxin [bacterium]